ncbi:MAG TPA: class I SAM-dependent methyltransferase [Candidatus Hodarchaeales archaeon]|nr:class I SAM-dependent methyltransferase [Candidatus Hodarchaeales archaeon]
MPRLFDIFADIYDAVMPKRQPIELLRLLNLRKWEQILEIGAGTGRIAKHYSYLVDRLYLLDPSPRMLEKASKLIPSAKIVVGISEQMDFPDNSFHKILCYDSLHHWQGQIRGLKECLRVLRPNGRIFFVEVDPRNFWGKGVILLERLLRFGSRFHTPEILTHLLRVVGFEKLQYDPLSGSLAYCIIGSKHA